MTSSVPSSHDRKTARQREFQAVVPVMIAEFGLAGLVVFQPELYAAKFQGKFVLWLNASDNAPLSIQLPSAKDTVAFSSYETAFEFLSKHLVDPLERLASL